MPKCSPDTLRSLLADDGCNITLADELQSAIAHAIGKFLGDCNLAVFALADDVLDVMLPAVAGLDLTKYEIETEADIEEDEPTAGPFEVLVVAPNLSGELVITPLAENDYETVRAVRDRCEGRMLDLDELAQAMEPEVWSTTPTVCRLPGVNEALADLADF